MLNGTRIVTAYITGDLCVVVSMHPDVESVKSEIEAGRNYAYIHFVEVPTEEEKQAIESIAACNVQYPIDDDVKYTYSFACEIIKGA